MIQRYEPIAEYIGSGDYVGNTQKAADGEYVLLSDVLALLAPRDTKHNDPRIINVQNELLARLRAALGAE